MTQNVTIYRDGGCKMKLDSKLQEFQGQTPKQYIRFRIEKFGMFIFDRGIISGD